MSQRTHLLVAVAAAVVLSGLLFADGRPRRGPGASARRCRPYMAEGHQTSYQGDPANPTQFGGLVRITCSFDEPSVTLRCSRSTNTPGGMHVETTTWPSVGDFVHEPEAVGRNWATVRVTHVRDSSERKIVSEQRFDGRRLVSSVFKVEKQGAPPEVISESTYSAWDAQDRPTKVAARRPSTPAPRLSSYEYDDAKWTVTQRFEGDVHPVIMQYDLYGIVLSTDRFVGDQRNVNKLQPVRLGEVCEPPRG